MTTRRSRLLVGLALSAGLVLSGCSNESQKSEQNPDEVLAAAKANLDETSGVHVALSTDKLPQGVSGILSAQGVGTHAPAFEGTLKVVASGISADAEVVAVDDMVYAKLPFTTKFAPIDPADYGAPDPADLMRTDGGLSSLLTSIEDVEAGKAVRDGDLVLTEYSGTVPGEAVARIIPTAAADSDFDATFTVTEDDVLNTAVLTGPFYPKGENVTYTIKFDEYGTENDITAP
ncbi:MAG TPA: LppX_LprAFG lipoprotein [Nocardioidaceae bacterium]|nr:LppX_LprAFG lipoprotein [Nocardioidaceae bacterium]